MDIFDQEAGRGVGGRITDVLLKRSINHQEVRVFTHFPPECFDYFLTHVFIHTFKIGTDRDIFYVESGGFDTVSYKCN